MCAPALHMHAWSIWIYLDKCNLRLEKNIWILTNLLVILHCTYVAYWSVIKYISRSHSIAGFDSEHEYLQKCTRPLSILRNEIGTWLFIIFDFLEIKVVILSGEALCSSDNICSVPMSGISTLVTFISTIFSQTVLNIFTIFPKNVNNVLTIFPQ